MARSDASDRNPIRADPESSRRPRHGDGASAHRRHQRFGLRGFGRAGGPGGADGDPPGDLKRRATAAGVPTIYINDNFGQWRSDFRKTVAHCTARSSPGRQVSRAPQPTSRDYFVLKPKHSGFFDTTLDTLLETLRIRRVILTGIAGNICVLFTANDAHMRELKIFAPADCIVSNTAADNDHALRQIETVLKGNVAGVDPPDVSQGAGAPGKPIARMSSTDLAGWIRDRGLTLVLLLMFLLSLVAQMATGFAEYNAEQREHGRPTLVPG